MAAIVELKQLRMPSFSVAGVDSGTHVVRYHAKTDIPLPSAFVLQLAQELVGSLPANNPDGTTPDEILNPWDRLLWSSGNGFVSEQDYSPGIAGINEFLADGTVTGDKFYDGGAVAHTFAADLLPNCANEYEITVTFRPPSPAANERYQQAIQLLAGRVGAGPPQQISFDGSDKETWIEQRFIQKESGLAYPVTGGNAGATAQLMIMPNWEKMPAALQDEVVDVLVIAQNVESPSQAVTWNRQYVNTTNNAPVSVFGTSYSKYEMYYEATRVSRETRRDNNTYHRAETRIILAKNPRFIRRTAEGTYYLEGGDRTKPIAAHDVAGEPVETNNLAANGDKLGVADDPIEVTYLLETPVSYAIWAVP